MAYFLLSFFLCSAFISVCRCCSCLPSHPQNEYCNSAFGEYTWFILISWNNAATLHVWRTSLKSTSLLFDCSVTVFWHSYPLVPNYQRSTRFYRKKQLFVRVHFTMKPEINEMLQEQLWWNVWRRESVNKITCTCLLLSTFDCVRNTVTHILAVVQFFHCEVEVCFP